MGQKKVLRYDKDNNPVFVENKLLVLENTLRSAGYEKGESILPTIITIRNDNKGRMNAIQAPVGTKRLRIMVLSVSNENHRDVVGEEKAVIAKFKDGNINMFTLIKIVLPYDLLKTS